MRRAEGRGAGATLLSQLTPRQEQIVRMLYGIGEPEGRPMTEAEVGQRFAVTVERVRQIERLAIRRLVRLAAQTRLAYIRFPAREPWPP